MTQREGESLAELDPDSLLFGGDDDELLNDTQPARQTWADRRRDDRLTHRRRRLRGRLGVLIAILIVAAVALFVVPRTIDYFRVKDYSGSGYGSVTVRIPSGATASDIGAVLDQAGVIQSGKAFTQAASSNSAAKTIEPGSYTLRKHMSGKSALLALLNPGSRDASHDVVVTEGATVVDVGTNLAKVLGGSQHAAIAKAIGNVNALGLPLGYKSITAAGSSEQPPSSAEGFLYPATYTLDPGSTPEVALQRMVARFVEQDRSTGFAEDAKTLAVTPYQALIIASIAQAEAKFATDMPKVARVILNRIKLGKPLQIDATSAYVAKLEGLDPSKVVYAQVAGPYNTYHHVGLPPTPIDNPGSAAMVAAVHPATGNWLYYVNGDSAGHLFFTHSEAAFAAAAKTCRQKHWGCG